LRQDPNIVTVDEDGNEDSSAIEGLLSGEGDGIFDYEAGSSE
jgi:hypothetical protein